MKRGKDDERIMGPMFPRLHVNDQEKGGPRAPPRNKMALYEQLSIPSQRFNRPGLMPHSRNNNANNDTPPASSSQGNGHEKHVSFPVPVPPSKHPIEKPPSRYLSPSASLPQVEQRKESDEDDFRVPTYVFSKTGQNRGDYQDNMDTEKLSTLGPAYSSHSMKLQNASNNPKHNGSTRLNVRQNAKNQNEGSISKAVSYSQSVDEAEVSPKQADKSLSLEPREDIPNHFSRLQNARSNLQLEPEEGVDSRQGRSSCHKFSPQLIDLNCEYSSVSLRNFPGEMPTNHDVVTNDGESRQERTCRSSQANIGDKGDDISETSMVESVSGVDITPDDVVGIIGQKHFWKARRAIVNQQRVFAVQVFELHRLIKVQRLIAESPHLLLEDDSYLDNPIKASSPKKLPLEYILEQPTNILKNKNEPEKPNDKMECSAENTVGKMSVSSVQNGSHPFNYRPFPGNSQPTPVTNDTNGGPWVFHPQQGHQWLVPVMTPTEGLVYKPYSGPGFGSPLYGGHGPPGSTPAMGNFSSPQHYQGAGVPNYYPPAGPHGYFPQYGMPIMNPGISGQALEQTSHFINQDSQGEFSGGGANFSAQRQISCNQPAQKGETFSGAQRQNSCNQPAQKGETFSGVQRQNSCNQPAQNDETFSGVQRQNSRTQPAQKGGTFSGFQKSNPAKDKELHTSTASSPSRRTQRSRLGKTIEGSNALPLFPTSPARTEIPNASISRHEDEQRSRVIKVVPHNGRSASEFAARIFRSIQEERNQNDSG